MASYQNLSQARQGLRDLREQNITTFQELLQKLLILTKDDAYQVALGNHGLYGTVPFCDVTVSFTDDYDWGPRTFNVEVCQTVGLGRDADNHLFIQIGQPESSPPKTAIDSVDDGVQLVLGVLIQALPE